MSATRLTLSLGTPEGADLQPEQRFSIRGNLPVVMSGSGGSAESGEHLAVVLSSRAGEHTVGKLLTREAGLVVD